jgi:hypothetical protein
MITLDYGTYAEGQKDWAECLSKQAETNDPREPSAVALAALQRMMSLNGRRHLVAD